MFENSTRLSTLIAQCCVGQTSSDVLFEYCKSLQWFALCSTHKKYASLCECFTLVIFQRHDCLHMKELESTSGVLREATCMLRIYLSSIHTLINEDRLSSLNCVMLSFAVCLTPHVEDSEVFCAILLLLNSPSLGILIIIKAILPRRCPLPTLYLVNMIFNRIRVHHECLENVWE